MSLIARAEALLRTRRPDQLVASIPPRQLILLLMSAGFAYGAIMGSYTLRPLQVLYSGTKVPILLTASSIVCLPSFFVINTLLGLRDDFPTVLRSLISTQLTMALVLVSLAPFTAFTYLSAEDYNLAKVFNGIMFLVASLAGHVQLTRVYDPLIARNPRHRIARRAWLTLYIVVTIQLAWMLRPFVGAPGMPTTFFREGVWDNAYVVVINEVWSLLSR